MKPTIKTTIDILREIGREKIAAADRVTKRSITGKPPSERRNAAIITVLNLNNEGARFLALADKLEKGE